MSLLTFSSRSFLKTALSARSSVNYIRMMSSNASVATPVGDVDGGPITESIISKIQTSLKPTQFAIYNDSRFHAHHAEQRNSSNKVESHFRLEIVSDEFKGKTQPARHRLVYGLLAEELSRQNGVHALSLKTKTPEEWEKLQKSD